MVFQNGLFQERRLDFLVFVSEFVRKRRFKPQLVNLIAFFVSDKLQIWMIFFRNSPQKDHVFCMRYPFRYLLEIFVGN